MKLQSKYTVFGNPIEHSQSPTIQQAFARKTKRDIDYDKSLGSLDLFEEQIKEFFANGGQGCNVTAPFKSRAFQFAHIRSKRCEIAESANTLKLMPMGEIYADNTDGIGLISDLLRLSWIQENEKILILGAGGATQGIIYPLLQKKQIITIANRNQDKAKSITNQFKQYGTINDIALSNISNDHYNLIINTIPNNKVLDLNIDTKIFHQATKIYDLSYLKNDATNFIKLAQINSVNNCADGKGMLVYQGAHAFNLWFNCQLSETTILEVLNQLNTNN